MGNLINPIAFRLKNNIAWNSIWVSYQNHNYSYIISSDYLIHSYINWFIQQNYFNKFGWILFLSHYKILRYNNKIIILFFYKEYKFIEFFIEFLSLFSFSINKNIDENSIKNSYILLKDKNNIIYDINFILKFLNYFMFKFDYQYNKNISKNQLINFDINTNHLNIKYYNFLLNYKQTYIIFILIKNLFNKFLNIYTDYLYYLNLYNNNLINNIELKLYCNILLQKLYYEINIIYNNNYIINSFDFNFKFWCIKIKNYLYQIIINKNLKLNNFLTIFGYLFTIILNFTNNYKNKEQKLNKFNYLNLFNLINTYTYNISLNLIFKNININQYLINLNNISNINTQIIAFKCYFFNFIFYKKYIILLLKFIFLNLILREYKLFNKFSLYFFETLKLEYLTSNLISKNIIGNLKKDYVLNKIIFPILNELIDNSSFYLGWKIGCFGRFQRRGRAKKQWFKEGKLPLSTMISNLDYSFGVVRLRNGVCSIKVYIIRVIKYNYIL